MTLDYADRAMLKLCVFCLVGLIVCVSGLYTIRWTYHKDILDYSFEECNRRILVWKCNSEFCYCSMMVMGGRMNLETKVCFEVCNGNNMTYRGVLTNSCCRCVKRDEYTNAYSEEVITLCPE